MKLIIILFSLLVGNLQAMERGFAEPAISFKDFITQDSALRRSFEGLSQECRIAKLLKYAVTEQPLCIRITEVPGIDQTEQELVLCVDINENRMWVMLYDGHKQQCFSGVLRTDGLPSYLLSLKACSLTEPSSQRRVTGTTAMKIWDALCTVCAAGRTELMDASLKDCFDIWVLSSYVSGSTWYMRYGYQLSDPLVQSRYSGAVAYVRNRLMREMLDDFSDDDTGRDILDTCLQVTQLTSDATFGELLLVLYKKYREEQADELHDLLRDVYTHCITDYPHSENQRMMLKAYEIIKGITKVPFCKVYSE